jgi:hypothetical protein
MLGNVHLEIVDANERLTVRCLVLINHVAILGRPELGCLEDFGPFHIYGRIPIYEIGVSPTRPNGYVCELTRSIGNKLLYYRQHSYSADQVDHSCAHTGRANEAK